MLKILFCGKIIALGPITEPKRTSHNKSQSQMIIDIRANHRMPEHAFGCWSADGLTHVSSPAATQAKIR